MMGRTSQVVLFGIVAKRLPLRQCGTVTLLKLRSCPLYMYIFWEGEHDTNFLQITCKKCQNRELFMTGPGVQFCFKWLKIRFDVPQDCDT